MAEPDQTEKVKGGFADVMLICRNLAITGHAEIRIDMVDGVPKNYGFSINKKSCIKQKKV